MLLDVWTSSNGYGFLAIVLHYITEDWCLGMQMFPIVFHLMIDCFAEELLIDFQEIIGEHSGKNLAHAVWKTVELYGLKGCVSTQFPHYMPSY